MVHHISLNDIEKSDDTQRRFWHLETIGIRETQDRARTAKETAILQEFHASYRIEDGRRVVSLPRKKDILLSDIRTMAEKRFQTLQIRLQANADFKSMYHNHMLDYILKNQVEVVPPDETFDNVFHLPHHAVKKGKRGATKCRIVFDASSHEQGFPSLNDTLEMGPNLLPEKLAILLRFRMYEKALDCDGNHAFLQLSLNENDRDLTRFLWYRVELDSDGIYQITNDVIA
ncbi:uncharacterized protein LOC110834758 [Zootermopsis nevadensis]|nr:uncharacterized protein LOC110834758 [Zootermopsis nevadensis]